MASKAKRQIEQIIAGVSKGNPTLKSVTITRLILRGLNPDKFTDSSVDDPVILEKIKKFATDNGITVN
jgi:hypothetical protein